MKIIVDENISQEMYDAIASKFPTMEITDIRAVDEHIDPTKWWWDEPEVPTTGSTNRDAYELAKVLGHRTGKSEMAKLFMEYMLSDTSKDKLVAQKQMMHGPKPRRKFPKAK